VLKDACDVFLDIVAQLQAISGAGNELPKQRFSSFDRLEAQVASVEMNQIKSVQKDRWLILALAQHIKYGQTICVAPYSLAIDQEGLGPYRFRGTNDCREAARLVIATTGEEAHAVSVPAYKGPVSVELDLMKPI